MIRSFKSGMGSAASIGQSLRRIKNVLKEGILEYTDFQGKAWKRFWDFYKQDRMFECRHLLLKIKAYRYATQMTFTRELEDPEVEPHLPGTVREKTRRLDMMMDSLIQEMEAALGNCWEMQ